MTTRTYKAEFPTFALDQIIPPGFTDESWGNDAMPHWVNTVDQLSLWINFKDYDDRESGVEDYPRFALYRIGFIPEELGRMLIQTDDYTQILDSVTAYSRPARIPPFDLANLSVEQCDKWLTEMCAAGLAFHLDDDVKDIGNRIDGKWVPTFTTKECEYLANVVAVIQHIQEAENYDPFKTLVRFSEIEQAPQKKQYKTYSDFVASRQAVTDLGYALNNDDIKGAHGYIYLDGFYIDLTIHEGVFKWHLIIERSEWIQDSFGGLQKLLWEHWACGESNGFDQSTLTVEYQLWCHKECLPCLSADELILRPNIRADQKSFLQDFLNRWNIATATE